MCIRERKPAAEERSECSVMPLLYIHNLFVSDLCGLEGRVAAIETRLGIPTATEAGEKEENFDLFGSDEVCAM